MYPMPRCTTVSGLLPGSLSIYLPGMLSRMGSIWLLIAGGTIVMVLGLSDDRWGLDWRLRLLVEVGVASAVVYGQHLQLTAYIDAPWLTSVLSVLWIVMLINAFNMLDNMDALSGGVAAIVCGMLAIMLLTIKPLRFCWYFSAYCMAKIPPQECPSR